MVFINPETVRITQELALQQQLCVFCTTLLSVLCLLDCGVAMGRRLARRQRQSKERVAVDGERLFGVTHHAGIYKHYPLLFLVFWLPVSKNSMSWLRASACEWRDSLAAAASSTKAAFCWVMSSISCTALFIS